MKVFFTGSIWFGNCDEFGHVHFQKFPGNSHDLTTLQSSSNRNTENNENCHEGKSVFAYAPFPALVFDFAISKFDLIFDFIFSVDNNFQNPYLEPHRKPPKYS